MNGWLTHDAPVATDASSDGSTSGGLRNPSLMAAHSPASSLAAAFPSLSQLRPDVSEDYLREATPADLERLRRFAEVTSGGCVATGELVSKLRAPKVVHEVQVRFYSLHDLLLVGVGGGGSLFF